MLKSFFSAAKCVLVALLLVGLVSGCKSGSPGAKMYVKQSTGQRLRIAVLPFDNVSRDQDAGRIITSTVVTYLLSTGMFDVVEPGLVNSTMAAEGVRMGDSISTDAYKKLQARLNADAFIIGLVEEYGDVRVGADSYPSISFSARLVDAGTTDILWAATISKTGADDVKIFDIGRENSLGRLSKKAVASMAASLLKSRSTLFSDMKGAPAATDPGTTAANPAGTSAGTVAADASARYLDETAVYGQNELMALLKDIGDLKRGEVEYLKHYHGTVQTRYSLPDGKKFIEVKLVDYVHAATTGKFLASAHPDEKSTTFEGLTAYAKDESQFSYYRLELVMGRFGLYLKGPKAQKEQIETLARGIKGLLK